jgi:DinB superfamily
MIIFRIALYLLTMTKQIEIVKKTRFFLLDGIKDLTAEQLNKVPDGFNNNIIWNIAHLMAAQQGICYVRAGLPTVIDEKLFLAYKSGTKPEQFVDATEAAHIKHLFLTTIDRLETDYNNNIFGGYVPWTTRYGVEIRNIDDTISFLPMHEGLHLGYIMAMKRVVG